MRFQRYGEFRIHMFRTITEQRVVFFKFALKLIGLYVHRIRSVSRQVSGLETNYRFIKSSREVYFQPPLSAERLSYAFTFLADTFYSTFRFPLLNLDST